MRIVTLLARHGTERYADAVDRLDEWFAERLSDVVRDLIISDNALPTDYEEQLEPGRVLVGSSNAHWEFSAWDRALAHVDRRIDAYDFVHLATSAFAALNTEYLERFDSRMLATVLGRKAAVGHIDNYNEPVSLEGHATQAWLRSSWIFLPPREVQRLGSFVSITDGGAYFSGDPEAPFRVDAPLSPNFQQYILGWLTGDGTGQGIQWHSRFRLSSESLPYFEAKTLAILNEQMLSIRLQAQGCPLVDATWLASRSVQRPKQPLTVVPTWEWQTTARRLIANMRMHKVPAHLRAALVVSESWAIAQSHGAQTARIDLWQTLVHNPWLLTHRPVLGALRRRLVG